MAPIWFPLILYLSIDIHVFLVIIPFGCIYIYSSNSSGLFLDIEIFVDSIFISPWAPGTCAAVLGCFHYICNIKDLSVVGVGVGVGVYHK